MRWIILCVALVGCNRNPNGNPSDCSLDTVTADCAASCSTPGSDVGQPGSASWPCRTDPLCEGGHWRFDCRAVPDLSVAVGDLSMPCTLATIPPDCLASCGADGGNAGSDQRCRPDPLCVDGHWRFDCN